MEKPFGSVMIEMVRFGRFRWFCILGTRCTMCTFVFRAVQKHHKMLYLNTKKNIRTTKIKKQHHRFINNTTKILKFCAVILKLVDFLNYKIHTKLDNKNSYIELKNLIIRATNIYKEVTKFRKINYHKLYTSSRNNLQGRRVHTKKLVCTGNFSFGIHCPWGA